MTTAMILSISIGAVLGTIVGKIKFDRPLVGAIFGAALFLSGARLIGGGPKYAIANVTTDQFQAKVLDASMPVLVDFYADWCGPCRKLAPTIDELAEEYAGKIKVVKVDVEVSGELARLYGRGSPTVMLFMQSYPVQQWVGPRPKSHYAQAIDAVLQDE